MYPTLTPDIVLDADCVVRRGLLFLWHADGSASLSLPLRQALAHLSEDGTSLAPAPNRPEWIRLGAATVPALEPDSGSVTFEQGHTPRRAEGRRAIGIAPQALSL